MLGYENLSNFPHGSWPTSGWPCLGCECPDSGGAALRRKIHPGTQGVLEAE